MAQLLLFRAIMLVSSLVLRTKPNFSPHDGAALLDDERLELGEVEGRYLPAVTTTLTLREARDLAEALLKRSGVADVQLISWADDEPNDASDDPSLFLEEVAS